ncbi:MAG TPA: T9SS type A sorting domain-containing protein [Flavobacterium sp.]|nr:T9SS type A sorting domain-containing protein [Flavobacterium sp.]
MKKALHLSIIFIFSFAANIFSQEYHPLLNNSSWNVRIFHSCCTPIPDNHFISEGTPVTFDSVEYLKFDNYSYNFPVVYLREDVATKRVYRRINGVDVILYDFSLETGDMITLGNGSVYTATVSTIDLNGEPRKQITLNRNQPYTPSNVYYDNEIWIEGVGSTRHPLVPGYQVAHSGTGSAVEHLTCAFQNGVNTYTMYIDPVEGVANCDAMLLGTKDYEQLTPGVSFHPNPFHTQLTIDSQSPLRNGLVKLYNLQGQLIKTYSNLTGRDATLNRGNLPSGLYFIQLSDQDKLLKTAKIMVD